MSCWVCDFHKRLIIEKNSDIKINKTAKDNTKPRGTWAAQKSLLIQICVDLSSALLILDTITVRHEESKLTTITCLSIALFVFL